MTDKEIWELVESTAKNSKCTKRKVGCVITHTEFGVVGKGFNLNPNKDECEDASGITYDEVIHAEISAINSLLGPYQAKDLTAYINYQPCDNCRTELYKVVNQIKVENTAERYTEEFMKFDDGKLMYDLIPPESILALATTLTKGAKKYKKNNWKLGDKDRYYSALMRHLESWRLGEDIDPDSGDHHLQHVLTNALFLHYIEAVRDN